jgi:WD40 repeat protein
VQVENVMIAANANTVFKAMDYSPENKLIAYAASNSVLILDPYHETERQTGAPLVTPKVLFGLTGHTTRINAVQWLTKDLIVSIGGDEKLIIVWQKGDGAEGKDPASWSVGWKVKDAHPGTINYLTTYQAA